MGHTLVTIRAADNDEPDSGSSIIQFHVSSGNEDGYFAVETNGTGVGHVVVAKVNVNPLAEADTWRKAAAGF